MNNIYFYFIFIILLIFSGCSASKKAYKKAQEYEKSGLYVEAAEQDLKALREKHDFKEALVHLKEVAPKAYDELIRRTNTLAAAGNWDQAVTEYERLQGLLEKFNKHGVVFETANVVQRLNKAKHKAAELHYTKAESLFVKKRWQKAAYAYLKAHTYIENYNNSFQKAIQAFLHSGDRWLAQKKYSNALKAYQKIVEIAPQHPNATQRIAETHYQLGRQYFKEGRYREALAQFENTQEFIADYKDVGDWAQRAYDEAVQFVAVFPFQNFTDYSVDGYFFASEILARAINANLKFVEFLPEADMNSLLNRLTRERSNRFIEAELLKLSKDEGLDAVVWGRVQKVDVREKPESFTEYEYETTTVVEDSSGKKVEETEPIFYREYTKSRTVRIAVEYFILETETGKYLDRQRFVEDILDKAHWVGYQGSIYDLPESKRQLLDAPRDPRPSYVLINELLAKLSKKISREVIRFYK